MNEEKMNEEKMNVGKELDKVLYYVCDNLARTGHNSKPVLLHSFKVSYRLLNYGYNRDIVISSALHDLIEDTSVTYEEIKKEFGKKIADIVRAVSFKENIADKYLQAKELFLSISKKVIGKEKVYKELLFKYRSYLE